LNPACEVSTLFGTIAFMPFLLHLVAMCISLGVLAPHHRADAPFRIAVVGLTHDHVHNILHAVTTRDDLVLVGVYEPKRERFDALAARYHLDPALYFDTLDRMLDAAKPEGVSVMGPIKDHLAAVEACAPRGVHLLLEKPLAFSTADAQRMADLARRHNVHILTNFETSWYASVREAQRMVESGERAPLRKMVFRHGHKGPKEIGCSQDFLDWLTDPELNGGGAIIDFGCYGAAIATWLMHGERPLSVTASAATLKPDVYPKVDDDATIVLTYKHATAILEASWCWTHDVKEMDLFTERGSIHAGRREALAVRDPNAPPADAAAPPLPEGMRDEWTYFRRVVRRESGVDPLSSLETNVIVADILEQAVRSSRGRMLR
jgi:predicted dehydrogenase